MPAVKWELKENKAVFTGELSRNTINEAFEKSCKSSFYKKDIVVDLESVDKVDSAGLAWLLILVENAKSTNNEISLHNIPNDLLKLAKLSAVDLFLPAAI